MITDRYYYSTLNAEEKKAYKALYMAIAAHEGSAAVQISRFRHIDVHKVALSVNLDNPLLYYVDFNNMRYSMHGGLMTFDIAYFFSKADSDTLRNEMRGVLKKITDKVMGNSPYELVCSIHDVLVRNVLYDTRALCDLGSVLLRSNTILGVLFYKTAVCEGIAKTFKLLLNIYDFPSIVALGRAANNTDPQSGDVLHAWNLVRISGCNFSVDVTWDINASSKQMIRHDYLLLPDSMMHRDHTVISDIPRCTTLGQDYYSHFSLVFDSRSRLATCLLEQLKKGKRSLEFRISDGQAEPQEFITSALEIALSHSGTDALGACRLAHNPSQGVFALTW